MGSCFNKDPNANQPDMRETRSDRQKSLSSGINNGQSKCSVSRV